MQHHQVLGERDLMQITVAQWIPIIGLIIIAVTATAKLMWKMLMVIGILVFCLGAANLILGWIK